VQVLQVQLKGSTKNFAMKVSLFVCSRIVRCARSPVTQRTGYGERKNHEESKPNQACESRKDDYDGP
jgi:hypothetical protein